MNKKAQVWIESVLYTLIGLVLMGMVLGFAYPKITEMREKSLVDQAVNSMAELDGKITEAIQKGTGNMRTIEFSLKTGELYINSSADEIILVLKGLSKPRSQLDIEISRGAVKQITRAEGGKYSVYLKLKYGSNIFYKGKDELKKFSAAATPYYIDMENKGMQAGVFVVDMSEKANR